jgi:hypothetical protein
MNIVFLAYGSQKSYQQVIFCILTLHYHLKGNYGTNSIIIYTDNDSIYNKYLTDIPVIIEPLTIEQINKYKGKHNFIHRVKTCICIEYFAKYKKDLFYLDGDTFFLKNPTPLFDKVKKGTSIMNDDEYGLDEADYIIESLPHWLMLRKAIRENTFTIKNEKVTIPYTTRMWNAGVTGLSYQDEGLLVNVLELTDQLYEKTGVLYSEQFALSYILQNHTRLANSEDYILHYWRKAFEKTINEQKIFDNYLDLFFKENTALSTAVLTQKAYELSIKYNELPPLIKKASASKRMMLRIKMMTKIAIKGYI